MPPNKNFTTNIGFDRINPIDSAAVNKNSYYVSLPQV